MDDFEGYFTLDGSVGLYSKSDNDVYHSIFGALSEAYDKFVKPAHIERFCLDNKEIKLLDICYGIGYNTKAFLNYFLENEKNIREKNNNTNSYIEKIDTNNILQKYKNFKPELLINYIISLPCIVARYTHNILKEIFNFIFFKIEKKYNSSSLNSNKYSIYIKAVDVNETFMKLSPFIKTASNLATIKKNKTGIIFIDNLIEKHKLDNSKNKICKYKLSKVVNYILIIKLIEKYKDEIFTENIEKILTSKETSKFFDKNMINFAKFYLKSRYNLSYKLNKLAFLHNIYYQYISKSYKNTLKVLENNDIYIEFIVDDARNACKEDKNDYSYIFLDAFTPTKTPSLWTEDFFKLLYSHMSDSSMLLTYSKSASIRKAMKNSNFLIGKIFNPDENKFTGTVATKNENLIDYKLNDFESGLLNTKAGITYKDLSLNSSNQEIITNRNIEVKNSDLQSSTNYINNFSGDKYEFEV